MERKERERVLLEPQIGGRGNERDYAAAKKTKARKAQKKETPPGLYLFNLVL